MRPRSLAVALTALCVAGCGEAHEAGSGACACDDQTCPDGLCDIRLTLPGACSEFFSVANVLVDGQNAGRAAPGSRFSSCARTLTEGASATVQVEAAGFSWTASTATCAVAGRPATADFCTLRFELAESCRGTAEQATVVVDSVEQGETHIDAPFVPCLLLVPGDAVQGTIRLGTELVLTAPLRCEAGGGQPRLIMECAQ